MQQDDQRPPPTPLRKAAIKAMLYGLGYPGFGLIFLGLLLLPRHSHPGLTLFGFSGGEILVAGCALVLTGLAILMLMQKISPVAVPVDAAQAAARRQRLENSIRQGQSRRLRWLLFLGSGLVIALPLIALLRMLQPTTPLLQGLGGADLERVGLLLGLVLALAGYGLLKLLRRGDSGAGR